MEINLCLSLQPADLQLRIYYILRTLFWDFSNTLYTRFFFQWSLDICSDNHIYNYVSAENIYFLTLHIFERVSLSLPPRTQEKQTFFFSIMQQYF